MEPEILHHREKLFYRILKYYEDLSNENTKYLRAYERLAKGKEKFLEGWTYAQVIQGRKGL